jgi:hypothetical protein
MSADSARNARVIERMERRRREFGIGKVKVGRVTSKTGWRETTESFTMTWAVITGAAPVVSRMKLENRTNTGLRPKRIPPECSISPRASALSRIPSTTGETMEPRRTVDSSTFDTAIFNEESVVVKGAVSRTVVAPPPTEAVGAATAAERV